MVRTNAEWAWEFLRRSPQYRRDYQFWAAGGKVKYSAKARATTMAMLDALDGRRSRYAPWITAALEKGHPFLEVPGGIQVRVISERIDPTRYLLQEWVDPRTTKLPKDDLFSPAGLLEITCLPVDTAEAKLLRKIGVIPPKGLRGIAYEVVLPGGNLVIESSGQSSEYLVQPTLKFDLRYPLEAQLKHAAWLLEMERSRISRALEAKGPLRIFSEMGAHKTKGLRDALGLLDVYVEEEPKATTIRKFAKDPTLMTVEKKYRTLEKRLDRALRMIERDYQVLIAEQF